MREKKYIIPDKENERAFPFIRDRKSVPAKEPADQTIRLGEVTAQDKLIFEGRPPELILKEIDSAMLQKEKTSRRQQSGGHSLSALCHFKSQQK
ncbi:MAG: hypothetical protein GXP46_02920 [Deferribacteres bacterium]|nr:hypothetical protein [Deferribacteres bacterium]